MVISVQFNAENLSINLLDLLSHKRKKNLYILLYQSQIKPHRRTEVLWFIQNIIGSSSNSFSSRSAIKLVAK